MRLPDLEYTSRPWRIHELTRDFRVEDAWALPAAGGRDDFPRLVAQLAAADPSRGSSRLSRVLWAIRRQIGGTLGWDGPQAGLGSRVRTLRERLPPDLRAAPGPEFTALPFTPLYLLGDEFAAEIANRTVHAVLHVGWVPDGDAYRGQLAVLVKPDGMLGAVYLAAIRPFRNLIVYPRMMRDLARRWRAGAPAGRARPIGLPHAARALSTLSRIDYEDAFFVRPGPGLDRTGEQWARAVLEGAPRGMRARLLRGVVPARPQARVTLVAPPGAGLADPAQYPGFRAAGGRVADRHAGGAALQARAGRAAVRDVRAAAQSAGPRDLGEGRAGAPADRRVAADARCPAGSREALLTNPRGVRFRPAEARVGAGSARPPRSARQSRT